MKKTIVFSWIYPLNVSNGGIERVTQRLINGLSKRGYQCLFLLHDLDRNRFLYDGQDVGNIVTFLKRKNVDVLVNQNGYSNQMTDILDESKWEGNYIVCHHNEPLYLRKIYNLGRVVAETLNKKNALRIRLGWLFRFAIYPIWQKISTQRISKTQELNYRYADYYVLLSRAFHPQLARLLGQNEMSKIVAIPNPLSFEIDPSEVDTYVKKNEVLIVARLNDGEKRISMALKAWREIEANDSDGWILKIIGDGLDALALQKIAREMGLQRVVFLGRQDSLPHYKTSSIFLMTSKVEGWGLTLTEAMQSGVVPIAFDSYASLRDIVEDGVTGTIVRDGDISAFAMETLNLMRDHKRRQFVAVNAVTSVQKFHIESVLDQWEAIL